MDEKFDPNVHDAVFVMPAAMTEGKDLKFDTVGTVI